MSDRGSEPQLARGGQFFHRHHAGESEWLRDPLLLRGGAQRDTLWKTETFLLNGPQDGLAAPLTWSLSF
ncbi:unnamed protein product [Boreogadus saida]